MKQRYSLARFECLCYAISMSGSKYANKIEALARRPVFTARDAREAGIPARMLSYFCKKGLIDRISRGVYMGSKASMEIDFQWEDLAIVVMSIPKGVVCLISALSFYGLTDQIMREFWIAVPNASKRPQRPKTRIIRMRDMDLGQTKVRVGGYEMRIFDRERTVVDAFRFLSQEVAIKALKNYLSVRGSQKPDLSKLMAYAKALRVDIHPFVAALTT